MEELFGDLGTHLFITGGLLAVFVVLMVSNTIVGFIKNIGIRREGFQWSKLRVSLLKLLGVVITGLAGSAALTVLPNAINMASEIFGMTEELQTLATSVDVVGTLALIACLGKACIQYGKNFLDGFSQLIMSDSDNNGVCDGMSA